MYSITYNSMVEGGNMYLNNYSERRQPRIKLLIWLAAKVDQKEINTAIKQRKYIVSYNYNSKISIRQINHTDQTGTSKLTAHFILRKQKFHQKKKICKGQRSYDEVRRKTFFLQVIRFLRKDNYNLLNLLPVTWSLLINTWVN